MRRSGYLSRTIAGRWPSGGVGCGIALSGYTRESFDGKDVYRRGCGPAVIVIAEMPGITPKVIRFADRVADLGCTAVMPQLFGTPGKDPLANGLPGAIAYTLSSFVPACIGREFTVLARGQSSPVVDWLRRLAAHEHERCGGPGVGAVGMCFTGGFALAMAADDRLLAPVLAQPSLPLAAIPGRANGIDISPRDLAAVKGRCARGELSVMGLRFKGDRLVPKARFDFLRRELGDAFVAIELGDSSAAPSPMPPHSPLTEHLVDEPGQPTREALETVLELFRTRLLAGQTTAG